MTLVQSEAEFALVEQTLASEAYLFLQSLVDGWGDDADTLLRGFEARIADKERPVFLAEHRTILRALLVTTAEKCFRTFASQLGEFHLAFPLAPSKLVQERHAQLLESTTRTCWVEGTSRYIASENNNDDGQKRTTTTKKIIPGTTSGAASAAVGLSYKTIQTEYYDVPCRERALAHAHAAALRVSARIDHYVHMAHETVSTLETQIAHTTVRGLKDNSDHVAAELRVVREDFEAATAAWHHDSSVQEATLVPPPMPTTTTTIDGGTSSRISRAATQQSVQKNDAMLLLSGQQQQQQQRFGNAYEQACTKLIVDLEAAGARMRENNAKRAAHMCEVHMKAAQFKLEDLLNNLPLPMDEDTLRVEFVRAKATAEAQYDAAVQHLADYVIVFRGARNNVSIGKEESTTLRNIASLRYAFNTPVLRFLSKASLAAPQYTTLYFFIRDMRVLLKREMADYMTELSQMEVTAAEAETSNGMRPSSAASVPSDGSIVVSAPRRYRLDLNSPLAEAWIENVLRTDLAAEYATIKSRMTIVIFKALLYVVSVASVCGLIYAAISCCLDRTKQFLRTCRRKLCCGFL